MFRPTSFMPTLGLTAVALVAATACNQPPPAPSVSISPEVPTTLDDLNATFAEVEDPNGGDNVSYGYSWQMLPAGSPNTDEAWKDMPELTGAVVPASLTEKGQSWHVTVTASDGTEVVSSEVSIDVQVANSLPEITSVRLSPGDGVDTFGLLTVNASAQDTDGDEVTIDYTWLVNGTAIDVQGQTLTGEHFGKADVITVEATPVDGESAGEATVSNAVTILNTPPRIDAVTISPEAPIEGSEVLCEPLGWYDADEDTPDVTATWLVNGETIEGVTGALTGEYFNKGDLIRCMGAPFDGDARGDVVVSEVVQVGNTPPTLGGVSLSDTAPKGGDVLSFTAIDAVDVDGDEITYTAEWFVDGEKVGDGNELPAGTFVKGQEVYVVVTPSDGLAVGDPVTSDLGTAVNTPPEIIAISMSPGDLYTDSIAFPGVNAIDADGDAVTYTKVWKVNGTVVSATGATLDGNTFFDKDDTVEVELTPNDGEDDGASMTSDVYTVLNSPPTQPAVIIDPEKPKSDRDLWCEILADSTDADGDDLERDLTWTRNGTTFSGGDTLDFDGDYIDAEDTEDFDTWVCTYSVTDGTDTVTASYAVDVLDWAGPRVFTPCGKTGYTGPSQSNCDTEYDDTPIDYDDGGVTVNKGWQEWVAPQDGTFRITASGASGGSGTYGSNGGHRGAEMRGDFTLKEGDKLRLLVGQEGASGSAYSSGGGGASWVLKSDGTVLMAAAGGGGNGYNYGYQSSCAGQAGSSARRMTGTWSSSGCSTSYTSTGKGGTYQFRSIGSQYWYGGGGAGHSGNGTYYTSTCYKPAYAANDSQYPGQGADGRWGDGGFGGGGCGGYRYKYSWSSTTYTSSSYGNGGGGGYTGGSAGYYSGGGGSSYNTGANASNTSNKNAGDGEITIDLAP